MASEGGEGEMASDIEVPEQSDSLGRSAQRAFRVIEALSLSGPSSLGKLAKELGFHKSTVHHVLRTLQSCGYVAQDQEGFPRSVARSWQLRNA